LALEEYDASLTLGHTKGGDILVSHPGNRKMFKLGVKTKYRTSPKEQNNSKVHGIVKGGWIMDEKHERMIDPSLFYCFVIISEAKTAFQFYIVPSRVVARYLKEEHTLWLKEKRKEGKRVKDTRMRVFRIGFKGNKYQVATPLAERYENNWTFREF